MCELVVGWAEQTVGKKGDGGYVQSCVGVQVYRCTGVYKGPYGLLTNSVATDCEGNPMSTSSCCSSPAEMLPAKMGSAGGGRDREGRGRFRHLCVDRSVQREVGKQATKGARADGHVEERDEKRPTSTRKRRGSPAVNTCTKRSPLWFLSYLANAVRTSSSWSAACCITLSAGCNPGGGFATGATAGLVPGAGTVILSVCPGPLPAGTVILYCSELPMPSWTVCGCG